MDGAATRGLENKEIVQTFDSILALPGWVM